MKLDSISKQEAARYMGVKGDVIPESVARLLDDAEKAVIEQICPRYVYREAALSEKDGRLYVDGMDTPLVGEDIKAHLKNCRRVVVMAATLTTAADKLIRNAGVGNAAEALAVDAVCSAAIEQVCDRAEEEIFGSQPGNCRTWRFSPGYGDFSIETQKELLRFLNAQRRIGLTVTDSFLLIPTKSVTAVIGISEGGTQQKAIKCEKCRMRDSCAFSKAGGCGK